MGLTSQPEGCGYEIIVMESIITTKNTDETQIFGRNLSARLKNGSVVALYGDLGSGKTQLVKGICRGLRVTQTVNSPTFIIVNEYSSSAYPKIFHFDLYRMKTQDEILDMGFADYLNNSGIVLIEWPEHVEDILPQDTVKIHIAHTDENENFRWIRLETDGN
jgi:tRNA threonylcarbamoyladenosine biosynthesis protein TsaE